MRRMTLLLGSILLMGSFAPAGADPLPTIYSVDHVQGDWVHRPKPGVRAHWYYVEADIVTDTLTGEVVSSRARAGVGPCSDGGNYCSITNMRDMRVVAYESDPLLQTAHLVIRNGDGVARIDFFANPRTAQPDESIHPCPGEADAYRDVSRSARATGVVFGRRVSSASDWDRTAETMQREIYTC